MFVDVTKPERSDFLSQTEGSLIPGYTGHCPTLKFRFGKRYGANTKEIIQDLSDRGILKRHLASQYRVQDPLQPILTNGQLSPISRTHDQLKTNRVDNNNRCRRYILGYTEHHISSEFPPIAGYTGHIPRLLGTEASLSQRFHTAAKRGLGLLQKERESNKTMEEAQKAVQIALRNSQPRYTTPMR